MIIYGLFYCNFAGYFPGSTLNCDNCGSFFLCCDHAFAVDSGYILVGRSVGNFLTGCKRADYRFQSCGLAFCKMGALAVDLLVAGKRSRVVGFRLALTGTP